VDEVEKANLKLEEVIEQLNGSNQDLLDVLSSLVDSDDIFTKYHSKYVAVYSIKIAKKMNVSPDQIDLLEKAALIHDIGKIGVKDDIISKPGRLSADEYNEVKRHPIIGARIIGRVRGFQALVPLVRGHHERWDGKGYPDGLKGDQIPKLARIISLADSVEAMLTDRVHRDGRKIAEVVEEIQRCTGTQFDPQVVEAFMKVVDEEDIGFFVNSAALADRFAFLAGVDPEKTQPRYMKNNID
jgi:putative nucleotidyltransferase with HDIG domain